MISNFRRVLKVVCFFFLGNSLASAYTIQKTGNYPEESIQQKQKISQVIVE